MITTTLLQIAYAFLNFLVSVLPTGHLPIAMTNAFAYFFGVANSFTYVFPIFTLMEALGVLIAFDAAIIVWHFIQWIIRKIPGMQ